MDSENPGDFYIMYHGTRSENVKSILRDGFQPSDHDRTMLGSGVYASRQIDKAACYGNVILTVLVHLGKVYKITSYSGHDNKTWQKTHDAAWVPNGIVPSGRQEHCIKDPKKIRVLGVVWGFWHLSPEVQGMTKLLIFPTFWRGKAYKDIYQIAREIFEPSNGYPQLRQSCIWRCSSFTITECFPFAPIISLRGPVMRDLGSPLKREFLGNLAMIRPCPCSDITEGGDKVLYALVDCNRPF